MKNQFASKRSSQVIFLTALLFVVAALVAMFGSWAFATETTDANNPDAQAEALPANETDGDFAFNSPGGKITISGLCYTLSLSIEGDQYENIPGCHVYFNNEEKATSDENGQFSFEVNRYSTGILRVNLPNGREIDSLYLSANETSTDCYYEFDPSKGGILYLGNHFVIVNATDGDGSPAGDITTRGTVNGKLDPDYSRKADGNMYSRIRFNNDPSDAERNAKIQIDEATNILSYS